MLRNIIKKIPFSVKIYSSMLRVFALVLKYPIRIFVSAITSLPSTRYFLFKSYKKNNFLLKNGRETYVVSSGDDVIGLSLYAFGRFDFGKFEKALEIIRSTQHSFFPELVIDIGANIGPICIPAVKRGLFSRAVAIEPDPKNYRILVANIYLNGLQNEIIHHNIALGDADGKRLHLRLSEHNHGDHRIDMNSGVGLDVSSCDVVQVDSCRLDTLMEDILEGRTLIWMDVQGFEGRVLAGAGRIISSRPPLVAEFCPDLMNRNEQSYENLKSALLLAGYGHFYDLSCSPPLPVILSEDSLDNLYKTSGMEKDLLFI